MTKEIKISTFLFQAFSFTVFCECLVLVFCSVSRVFKIMPKAKKYTLYGFYLEVAKNVFEKLLHKVFEKNEMAFSFQPKVT